MNEHSIIEETLQNQIHSTYSSRQWRQQQYWKDYIYHASRWLAFVVFFGASIAVFTSLYAKPVVLQQYPILTSSYLILFFFIIVGSIGITWHIGNWYIAFIRSIPKRVVHTQGVGSHFIVPFANKEKADKISQTVWEGIIQE